MNAPVRKSPLPHATAQFAGVKKSRGPKQVPVTSARAHPVMAGGPPARKAGIQQKPSFARVASPDILSARRLVPSEWPPNSAWLPDITKLAAQERLINDLDSGGNLSVLNSGQLTSASVLGEWHSDDKQQASGLESILSAREFVPPDRK